MTRLAVAMFLLWVAAARAQTLAPPSQPPTPAEYQGAIRQLAAGTAEDAGRLAQLRMTLGQVEAQRDAALARIKDLEAKAASLDAAAPAAGPEGTVPAPRPDK